MKSANPVSSFYIDGIRCLGCAGQIKSTLAAAVSHSEFELKYEDKTLELKGDAARQLGKVKKLLQSKGFLLFPANSKAATLAENLSAKKSLKEIGVAGAMAGNIMLFVIPVYAGLEGPLKTVFLWLSFLLFLPVLLFCARGFYQGAADALRSRTISVDLPIAIALTLTTAFSLFNLLNGSDLVYFDSTASFVFLILATRFFLEKYRRRILSPLLQDEFFSDVAQIEPGQTLQLQAGQILSFDAENLTENASFDTSFVDGESLPKTFAKGQKLASGFRAVGGAPMVLATSTPDSSRLAVFLKELNRGLLGGSRAVTTADRLSTALIATVLTLSALTMLSGHFFGWFEMMNRGVALLVIACPCALAFAAPVTAAAFLKKAIRGKIFLRDAAVLESLASIRNVFLDKTGTLTSGQLELVTCHPSVMSSTDRAVILALESSSEHPVAYAFRRAWNQTVALPKVENLEESYGQGVRGTINGVNYELKTLSDTIVSEELVVGFYKDGVLSHRFCFSDHLRPEAEDFVKELRRRQMQVYILSGDRQDRVARIARDLDIPATHLISEAFPEEKAQIVAKFPNSMMVGDGLNDAIAFAKANVGISVRGSMDIALNSAQVYCARPGLNPVLELLSLGDRYRKTMHRNLALALAYNAMGAALAIAGFVNPLIAAIAMPISSIVILTSSWVGLR